MAANSGGDFMKRLRVLCWVMGSVALLLMIGGTHSALAQDVTATIAGTVTDTSGGAVAGATVTAKSVERGETYTITTNDLGLYLLSQLPVGHYELRVEKQGFQTSVYPAFELVLNQVGRIDVQMSVGQVNQTIEVNGAAPILEDGNNTGRHDHRLGHQRYAAAGHTELCGIDTAVTRGDSSRSQHL
jgi:Carboxypeptidase regulatory-like domain